MHIYAKAFIHIYIYICIHIHVSICIFTYMYIYICTGVGYVGSTSGTQLSNFIAEYNSLPSVVLLDEFDHCDPETWEAFYHIFDEGVFTQKKAAGIIQISI
jgi:hypothetical protein